MRAIYRPREDTKQAIEPSVIPRYPWPCILGQSQPRVSRHLKLLAEAGLLDRHREGSWFISTVQTSSVDLQDGSLYGIKSSATAPL